MKSLTVCGRDLIIEGSILRTARLDGEKYKFIDDPASIVEGLRKAPVRVDLFTFMQRPTGKCPSIFVSNGVGQLRCVADIHL